MILTGFALAMRTGRMCRDLLHLNPLTPSPQGVRRPSEHAAFTGVLEGGA